MELELFWQEILSQDETAIKHAYDSLAPSEKKKINRHLRKMAQGNDWENEQMQSARFAFAVLENLKKM